MNSVPSPTATVSELLSTAGMFNVDGQQFRDLDHDGVLAPYEDWRFSPEVRVADLIGRMTLEEKVGLMLHGTAPAMGTGLATIGIGTAYDLDAIRQLCADGVNCVISRMALPPALLAVQHNAVQTVAAATRLGIPLTISTDPRHHFATVTGASVNSNGFSQWPETLGLAAIGDPDVVQRFGDIVRQEYRAVGIHMSLSPQADLGTEPRWPRFEGTFGSDPALVRSLAGAYVRGIQGGASGLTTTGVAAVVKHWVGYGASRDGFDGHNYYGRYSAFPGGRFQDHVDAFLDAFDSQVAGVMPTYNILEGLALQGTDVEPVGAGFNRQITTDLLRGTYGYKGMVLSDWSIAKDFSEQCRIGIPVQEPSHIAMPWGVEHLSRIEKFVKGVHAGIDQFGGESDPAPLLTAVRQGLISVERIDESAARVLVHKFQLGLFEAPFVDPEVAATLVGSQQFVNEGRDAQRRSITMLVSGSRSKIAAGTKVFSKGISGEAFARADVQTVEDLGLADVAVIRIAAPYEVLHPGHFFGRMQHEGSLAYPADHPDLLEVARLAQSVPVVAVVNLDRPAVLTALLDHVDTLYAVYGVGDDAVVDVLTGDAPPAGRLPFQLPSSMHSVLSHSCDVPNGLADPLFDLFHQASSNG